ncbi:hypothetical protein LTR16_011815, partial [Cryomyces antarcticus]
RLPPDRQHTPAQPLLPAPHHPRHHPRLHGLCTYALAARCRCSREGASEEEPPLRRKALPVPRLRRRRALSRPPHRLRAPRRPHFPSPGRAHPETHRRRQLPHPQSRRQHAFSLQPRPLPPLLRSHPLRRPSRRALDHLQRGQTPRALPRPRP